MHFPPKTRERLVKGFSGAFREAVLVDRAGISNESAPRFEALLRTLPADQQEMLSAYIGEQPMREFVSRHLLLRIMTTGRVEGRERMTDVPDFNDPDALAEEVVCGLESLPWTYRFAISLPESLNRHLPRDVDWPLGELAWLAKGVGLNRHMQVPGTMEEAVWLEAGGQTILPNYGPENAHLVVKASGLVDPFFGSRPYFVALDHIKAIQGMMLAEGLLVRSFDWERPKRDVMIYIAKAAADGQCKHDSHAQFGGSTADTINELAMGSPPDPLTPQEFISEAMWNIARIMAAETETRDKLLLGAQWYFDSFGGDNQLLCFVQSMVSLEILVGEDFTGDLPRIGVSELLRNRVAYLIGRNRHERQEILDTFGKLYSTRSRIVHRGHSRLTHEEARFHQTLRSYCARVIQAEARLLPEEGVAPLSQWLADLA